MLKHSQFNHLVRIPGREEWVLYNFASESLERMNSVRKELFEMAPELPEVLPAIAHWKKAGFLTDADEAETVKRRIGSMYQAIGRREFPVPLALKLYTTSACNFACLYCMQGRRGGPMDDGVQDACSHIRGKRRPFPWCT